MPKKTAAKKVAKKTSKKPARKPKDLKVNVEVSGLETMSDEALDKLIAAVVEVIDYDTFKEIFGDEPESPEDAAALKKQARDAARKHLRG